VGRDYYQAMAKLIERHGPADQKKLDKEGRMLNQNKI
jgi:hypothetical protein